MGQCRDGVQTFDPLDLVSDRFGSEMLNCETYHEVRRFNRELKLTPAQIAAKSVRNIKTIRKGLDKPRYEPLSKGSKRPSKLDPYKDLIVSCLEKHPYTGMQIFERLRSEHGYTGSRSILHDFIATVSASILASNVAKFMNWPPVTSCVSTGTCCWSARQVSARAI